VSAHRVVLVDDNSIRRGRVERDLRRAVPDATIEQATSAAEMTRALEHAEPSVFAAAARLGWAEGTAVVAAVKARHPDWPVIVYAARGGSVPTRHARRAGADTFATASARGAASLVSAVKRALDGAAGPTRAAEGRYRRLFDEAPAGMFQSTPAGKFLDVNAALTKMLGYPGREALLEENAADIYVNPEDRQRWRDLAESRGEVRDHELPLRRLDGRVIWTRSYARAARDENGDVAYYEGVVVDISESRQAAQALRESEERYRVVAETASDAIFTIDEDSTITFANRAAERIFGYSSAEMVGQPLTMLMPESMRPRHRDGLRRYIETGERHMPWEGMQLPGRNKSGKELTLEVSIGEHAKEGRRTITGIVRDISERKRLEEQLRQALKMEAIGRLAGGVAHDFNNLLTVILGHGELILGRAGLDEGTRKDMEEIQKAATRAGMLTRRLLAFSHRQVVRPHVLELDAVVADMERLLRRLIGEDVELETVLEGSAGRIMADPGQVEQVLMNLVVNSRDAMPNGGKLTVRTSGADVGVTQGQALGLRPGRYTTLTVTDTGVGMDAEVRSRIFEPFFTTKEAGRGTGLGLSTVYGIVAQCGGAIAVQSEPGRGATFTIYLPQVEGPAEVPSPVEALGLPRGRETILLLEDEDMVRAVAGDTLRQCGYTVIEARHGDEALELSGRLSGPIDLMISDVVMPGASGPEVVARVVRERPGTKVLYVSGHPERGLAPGRTLDPNTPLLQKPFTPEVLARTVRGVLDGAGLHAAS